MPARRATGRADPAGEDVDRTGGRTAARAGAQDQASLARSIALRQLAAAPRSRAQLAAALSRKNVPATDAEAVLDRFAEVGLVDDEAFAEGLVRARRSDRGLSRRALARELAAKGVSTEVAEVALATVDPEQERLTATNLVERKLRATQGLDSERRRRRLVAMLARRGYPSGLALAVVDEVLGAQVDPADADASPSEAPDDDAPGDL